METPEQRAERIFKEDDEKARQKDTQELQERQLKRLAVAKKHEVALLMMIEKGQRGIRFRRYFHRFVWTMARLVFTSEADEYQDIGKVGRRKWSDYEEHKKARFTKDEMGVVGDIMEEFGAYDY
jgi:hypothetical protein